jgi:hypothetical protein
VQVPSVLSEENDIRMDFIITEDGVLDCRILCRDKGYAPQGTIQIPSYNLCTKIIRHGGFVSN